MEVKDSKAGIDLFKAKLGQPIIGNRFVVEFTALPSPFAGLGADNLTILCKSATLPGKSIGTTKYLRKRNIPDGTIDYGGEVSFTYLCDSNFLDRAIIAEWLRYIHTADVDTRTLVENGKDAHVFRFQKPNPGEEGGYLGQCLIHVLRKDGSVALTYTLEECFPVALADIELSSDAGDTGVLEFSFDLQYSHWHSEYHAMDNVRDMNQPMDGNFSVSGLNKGRKIFDTILEGLKVAGRFNSKLGDLGRKLGSYDTAITRASNIGRDLGLNSEYITDKRRGG